MCFVFDLLLERRIYIYIARADSVVNEIDLRVTKAKQKNDERNET